MNAEVSQPIETYRRRIRALFDQIHVWLQGADLTMTEDAIELNEEAFGRYSVPLLRIIGKGSQRIATLEPQGASIIAADGRVDLAGAFGREAIVYLHGGDHHIRSEAIRAGHVSEQVLHPLFSGIEDDGWYWIDDARPGRAHALDQEMFRSLLLEVSDYAA